MANKLYEVDFYAWTLEQAEALRRRGAGGNALDYDNLAEEIADMGVSERRSCESYIQNIIMHLLKIEYVGPTEAVAHWRAEIAAFRGDLVYMLTPTLRKANAANIDKLYRLALQKLRAKLIGQKRAANLPEDCPYTWEDILGRGEDWTPEPPAGAPPPEA